MQCAFAPEEVNEKDRHVVQAALRAGEEVIVTFELRDFPSSAPEPIHIFAKHPSVFLLTLFSIEPFLVVRRIQEIAVAKNERPADVLKRLRRAVPAFVDHFAMVSGMDLGVGSGTRQVPWLPTVRNGCFGQTG